MAIYPKRAKHRAARGIKVLSKLDLEVNIDPERNTGMQMHCTSAQTQGTAPVLQQRKADYCVKHARSVLGRQAYVGLNPRSYHYCSRATPCRE